VRAIVHWVWAIVHWVWAIVHSARPSSEQQPIRT
jgi:hypothetical protein